MKNKDVIYNGELPQCPYCERKTDIKQIQEMNCTCIAYTGVDENQYIKQYECLDCESRFDIKGSIPYGYKYDLIQEKYSISINNVSHFRSELIAMVERVKYNIGDYKDLSSTEIAEKFEHKVNDNMRRNLTRQERWDWLKKHHHEGKYTIPWDRMELPSHEWFNNYTTIHNTDIPLKIPKVKREI